MKTKKKLKIWVQILLGFLKTTGIIVVIALVFGYPTMWLVNYVFEVDLSIGQALGLSLIALILRTAKS